MTMLKLDISCTNISPSHCRPKLKLGTLVLMDKTNLHKKLEENSNIRF